MFLFLLLRCCRCVTLQAKSQTSPTLLLYVKEKVSGTILLNQPDPSLPRGPTREHSSWPSQPEMYWNSQMWKCVNVCILCCCMTVVCILISRLRWSELCCPERDASISYPVFFCVHSSRLMTYFLQHTSVIFHQTHLVCLGTFRTQFKNTILLFFVVYIQWATKSL